MFSLLYSLLFILSLKALETILLFWICTWKNYGLRFISVVSATKPLKCILFVFVVLVLFQFYSKTTLSSQKCLHQAHYNGFKASHVWSGNLFMNFQRDYVHFSCHFYIIGILFFFPLCFTFLKFGARNSRWKVILWFNWIQLAHLMNVSFTSGSGQTDAGRRPHTMPPPSLTLVSMETGRWLTSHKLWAEGSWLPWRCDTDCAFCLYVCRCCAFSQSATVWLSLYCHPANTPKSCSGLLYSSTRGRSTEQTTQGRVVLILLRI